MVLWKRNLFLVSAAQFLASAGFSFAMPFIPFYIKELGITDQSEASMWTALFAASGNLALLLSAPFWGVLSDVVGRRAMVLRACFVSAIIIPMMGFVPGVSWLIALRFTMGLFAGTVTATQTLISSNTPVENRGFAMGAIYSVIYGGHAGGTFLGGIIVDALGYRWAFGICGMMLALAGCLVLFGVKENFRPEALLRDKLRTFGRRKPDFAGAGLILLAVLFVGFAVRLDGPFMPLLVETITGPQQAATWTGVIASACAIVGIASGTVFGWLADRYAPLKVAMWAAAGAGLLMIPQGLADNLPILAAARIGTVFCAAGLLSVFQIWLAKATPDAQRGALFGWATSFKSCGWFLSSLAGGAVAMHLGVRWVFFSAALAFLLLVPGTVIIRAFSKQDAPSASQELAGTADA